MTPSLVHPSVALSASVAWPRFDDEGFLIDGDRWTPLLAETLAEQQGIARLGDEHWRVIHLVRQRYHALGALPVMRLVCRAAGIDPHRAHRLFSSCQCLWRVAGLPHPGDEALAYMN